MCEGGSKVGKRADSSRRFLKKMTRRLSSANDGGRFPGFASEAKAPPSRTCERLQNQVLQKPGKTREQFYKKF